MRQSTFAFSKSLYVFPVCLFLFLLVLFFSPGSSPRAGSPEISAEAALVLDWNSGRILYAKEPHLPLPMASTTKIMTALLALEKGSLKDTVVTSARAAQTGGSSIWLEEGEKKTLEELLYGLMLRSGNDAAAAIAEHISGDEGSFAQLMTRRARELGARDTVFKNPHGLHHPEHYTTAYDLALISAWAMRLEDFRLITATPSIFISWPGHPWDRCLYNQNKLFELFPGAEGIKTGWTTPAGRCFVGAARRGGRRLISVVLNAPQMWEDTVLLLDFGFQNFDNTCLIHRGQHLKSAAVSKGLHEKVGVMAADNFYYPLKENEEDKIICRYLLKEPYRAPLLKGEKLGELEIYLEDKIIGAIDLVAGRDIEKINFWQQLQRKAERRG